MNIKSTKLKTMLVGSSLATIGCLFAASTAYAAGFQINVRNCPNSKGSLEIAAPNSGVWSQVKSKNPDQMMQSMVRNSNCFNVDGGSYSSYTLRYGPLTQQEFASGPSSFSGRSVLEPVSNNSGGIPQAGGIPQSGGGIPQSGGGNGGFNAAGGLANVDGMLSSTDNALAQIDRTRSRARNIGKSNRYYRSDIGKARGTLGDVSGTVGDVMALGGLVGGLGSGGQSAPKDRFAYVDVLNNEGRVVARGFGQNNRADLDFSNFEGTKSIKSSKKSKRMAGALYNALNDAQNRIMSPSFGSPIR